MVNSTTTTSSSSSSSISPLRRRADGSLVKGAARKRRAERRAERREEAISLEIAEADLHQTPSVEDDTSTMGPEPQYIYYKGGESDLPSFVVPKWARALWGVMTIRVW